MRKIFYLVFATAIILVVIFLPSSFTSAYLSSKKPGDKLDSLNGVYVYFNGGMNDTYGRNIQDGYNLGIKYQCVEFVKRYYYKRFNHKMPDPWGHAKDFYNSSIDDGKMNKARGLIQYKNGGKHLPNVDDLIVFPENVFNPYGHVAIVSKVTPTEIEIVQQNVGTESRTTIGYTKTNENITLMSDALGWLRLPNN